VLKVIQRLDRRLRILVALHFHEAEAARAAGLPVGDDLGAHDLAVLPEQFE